MLLIFRPFRIGQKVQIGGSSLGTVKELSLFWTELVTDDKVQVIVPNSGVWGQPLRNFSIYPAPAHTGEIRFRIPDDADLDPAIERVRSLVGADPRVLADPAPSVLLDRPAGDAPRDRGWFLQRRPRGGAREERRDQGRSRHARPAVRQAGCLFSIAAASRPTRTCSSAVAGATGPDESPDARRPVMRGDPLLRLLRTACEPALAALTLPQKVLVNHQQPRTALASDSGHSSVAAGTRLHAPIQTFGIPGILGCPRPPDISAGGPNARGRTRPSPLRDGVADATNRWRVGRLTRGRECAGPPSGRSW
jgi:hypothetical protein